MWRGFPLLVLVTIIASLLQSSGHHSRFRISRVLIRVLRARMTMGRKYALLPKSILISRVSSSTDRYRSRRLLSWNFRTRWQGLAHADSTPRAARRPEKWAFCVCRARKLQTYDSEGLSSPSSKLREFQLMLPVVKRA